jgi:hypothetical protein
MDFIVSCLLTAIKAIVGTGMITLTFVMIFSVIFLFYKNK